MGRGISYRGKRGEENKIGKDFRGDGNQWISSKSGASIRHESRCPCFGVLSAHTFWRLKGGDGNKEFSDEGERVKSGLYQGLSSKLCNWRVT